MARGRLAVALAAVLLVAGAVVLLTRGGGGPDPALAELTAGTCRGTPAASRLRPLPMRLSYTPPPRDPKPVLNWESDGVAVGEPVVRGLLRTTHPGAGSSIGAALARPGERHRAGFVIVRATRDGEVAMARARAASRRVGVVDPIGYRIGRVRWLTVDFQRGASSLAAVGCHVIEVGGANGYDASDIEECLSRPREWITRRPNPNVRRPAKCASSSPTAR